MGSLLLFGLLTLSACSKDDPFPEPNPAENGEDPVYEDLQVYVDGYELTEDLVFTSSAGYTDIMFRAVGDWSVVVAPNANGSEWCKVSNSSGSSMSQCYVTINVEQNEDYEERSVSVTITTGTYRRVLQVFQKQKDAILLSQQKFEVSPEGEVITIAAQTNVECQLNIPSEFSWIREVESPNPESRSLESKTYYLKIEPSEESVKRNAYVTLESNPIVERIDIYQSGSEIMILSNNTYDIGPEGGDVIVDFRSNYEYEILMPGDTWVSLYTGSRALSSHTARFVVQENDVMSPRTAVITIKSVNSDKTERITINQGAATTLPSGAYVGITGFNEDLFEKPICLLNESSQTAFNTFIDGLTQADMTLLCYGFNTALTNMQNTQYPEDLSSTTIITFTDGLDQGSLSRYKPEGVNNESEYLEYLNNRIDNETIADKKIDAYAIGLKSNLGGTSQISYFENCLKKLASYNEEKRERNFSTLDNMSSVSAALQAIARELAVSNSVQEISIKTPEMSNGTIFKYTFDIQKNGNQANSALYIKAKLNTEDKKLIDLEFHGMTSSDNGQTIDYTLDQKGFMHFRFKDIRTNSQIPLDEDQMLEWIQPSGSNIWIEPNEKTSGENATIETKKTTMALMLLLDCSSSLSETDFRTLKDASKSFINVLLHPSEAPSVNNASIVLQTSSSYPWTGNDADGYVSGNKGVHNSSSILYIQVTPNNSGTLHFDWDVSSESGYDILYINKANSITTSATAGTSILSKSGTASGHFSQSITSPTTIIVKYTKDGSQNGGSDRACVKNIRFE